MPSNTSLSRNARQCHYMQFLLCHIHTVTVSKERNHAQCLKLCQYLNWLHVWNNFKSPTQIHHLMINCSFTSLTLLSSWSLNLSFLSSCTVMSPKLSAMMGHLTGISRMKRVSIQGKLLEAMNEINEFCSKQALYIQWKNRAYNIKSVLKSAMYLIKLLVLFDVTECIGYSYRSCKLWNFATESQSTFRQKEHKITNNPKIVYLGLLPGNSPLTSNLSNTSFSPGRMTDKWSASYLPLMNVPVILVYSLEMKNLPS